MPVVAVLAFDKVVGFELMVPCQVFGAVPDASPDAARLDNAGWDWATPEVRWGRGTPRYELRVCIAPGAGRTVARFGYLRFESPWGLDGLVGLGPRDLVIVPGYADVHTDPPSTVLDALHAAAASGARIASICTGAFALAATGLLDGLRVTTHWRYARLLAHRFPALDVDPAALYIDNGQFLTAAGVAAGLDLCLHLLRRDHGAALAADTARLIVMPLQRDGGQAQFVSHPPPDDGTTLQPLLAWIEQRLHEPLTLPMIGRQAGTSVRSLHRRFRSQLGTSPLQWLLRARIQRARHLLETTDLSVERVAAEAGFGSAVTMRHHFGRLVGTAPHGYRSAFRPRTSRDTRL